MKSFRVYLRSPRPPAPPRFRPKTPPGDDEDVREAFRPALRRYRRLGRAGTGFGVAAVALLLFSASAPWPAILWATVGFLLCVVAAIATGDAAEGARCPRCRGLPLRGHGPFCPECGAPGLSHGSWAKSPHCDQCGRDMRRRKGRLYVIRACTHCGAWLDDDGM